MSDEVLDFFFFNQVRNIQRIISNTDLPYNDITSDNDWVILKLSSPLELNDNVFPACLPEADYLDISSTEEACFTSGWGTLSSGMIIIIHISFSWGIKQFFF